MIDFTHPGPGPELDASVAVAMGLSSGWYACPRESDGRSCGYWVRGPYESISECDEACARLSAESLEGWVYSRARFGGERYSTTGDGMLVMLEWLARDYIVKISNGDGDSWDVQLLPFNGLTHHTHFITDDKYNAPYVVAMALLAAAKTDKKNAQVK